MCMCLYVMYMMPQLSDVVKWPLLWMMKCETKHEMSPECLTLVGFGLNVCFSIGLGWL